ncbi:PAS domain S-box-containing protein [Desulfobaculum xiamenense]|uniref:PAS domain S-box-containing protein n=1 Tax=Desulfobaculum xiamenense TaxID=995050 RepID=A0A846QUW2_9BACT|nr:PAS domain-containing protein [Desulfobaculum xiamenense]NJB68914.1 PAS domain S-box-containing protein [Desulfobaculum xiamenense]
MKSARSLPALIIAVVWLTVGADMAVYRADILNQWTTIQQNIAEQGARSSRVWLELLVEEQGLPVNAAAHETFRKFAAPIRLLDSGHAWLFRDNTLVAGLDETMPADSIMRIDELCAMRGCPTDTEGLGLLRAAIEGRTSGQGFFTLSTERGRERAAWATFDAAGTTWTFGISTPDSEILLHTASPSRILPSILGALAMTVLVIALFRANHHRLELSRKMNDTLGELVERRTRDLSNANGELKRQLARRILAERRLRENREQLKALVENSPDIIARFDRSARHLYVNSRISKYVDTPREEIVGKTPRELGLCPEFCATIDARIEEAFRTRSLVRTRLVFDGPNGRTHFDWRLSPEFSSGGVVRTVLSFARDVTALRLSEERLRRSEEQYRLLVEHQSDMVVNVSPSGRILFASPSFCSLFALPEDRVRGCKVLKIVPRPERRAIADVFRQAITATDPLSIEFQASTPAGPRWLAWTGRVVHGADGETNSVVAIGRDVTTAKVYETRIQESLLEKETLLQEIHHRVKNNLQIVSSLLELAMARISSTTDRAVLMDITTKIQGMALIHNQIYSSDSFESVNIADYGRALCRNLVRSYGAQDIAPHFDTEDIHLSIQHAIPCGIVLNELFSNVIKHAYPDGQGGSLGFSVRGDDGCVRICVSDNGRGFPDDAATTTLGMKLVSNIVTYQLHGSLDIRVEDGTRIDVVFPAADAPARAYDSVSA